MKVKITHVAIFVRDLEKTKDYYTNYFGGRSNELYEEPEQGFSSYFITFDSEASLEIMSLTEFKDSLPANLANGWNHVAFSVGDRETVTALTEKLVSAGYELYSPPRETGDGYFESCVADPDGNRVEITE